MTKKMQMAICTLFAVALMGCSSSRDDVVVNTSKPADYRSDFLQQYSSELEKGAGYSYEGKMILQKGEKTYKGSIYYCKNGEDQALICVDDNGKATRIVWTSGQRNIIEDQSGMITSVSNEANCLFDIQELFNESNALKENKTSYEGLMLNCYELSNAGSISEHLFDSKGALVKSKHYLEDAIIAIEYSGVYPGKYDSNALIIPKDYSQETGISQKDSISAKENISLPQNYPVSELPLCTGARISKVETESTFYGIQMVVCFNTWLDFGTVDEWFSSRLYQSEGYKRTETKNEQSQSVIILGKIEGWKVLSINIKRENDSGKTYVNIVITKI